MENLSSDSIPGVTSNENPQEFTLALNFDYNLSLSLGDLTESHTPEQAVNEMLARNVMGQVVDQTWIPDIKNPYDLHPSKISYFNYLKHSDPKNYKNRAILFTDSEHPGEYFRPQYDSALPRYHDPFFRSFYHIIKQYPKAILIIRTFGQDGPTIERELSRCYRFKTAWITDTLEPQLARNSDESWSLNQFNEWLLSSEYLENRRPILIQEDYQFWNARGRSAYFGKVIKGHPKMIHIMWDDNPCVRIIGDNVHFRQVNTWSAFSNIEYFSQHVEEILRIKPN